MDKGKVLNIILVTTIVTFASVGNVSAQTRTPRTIGDPKPSMSPRVFGDPKPSMSPRAIGDPKPSGDFARSCDAILENVKRRSDNLSNNVDNMLGKFADIQAKVQNFYTGTVVPNGKTVPNYQALTNDVTTKKTAVDAALAKAKTDIDAMNCDSGNPKENVQKFNTDMRAVKNALGNYRTSVVKLITEVRGVARVKTSGSPRSFTPRGSAVPRPSLFPKQTFRPGSTPDISLPSVRPNVDPIRGKN